MSNIYISCPATGTKLNTYIEESAAGLSDNWNKMVSVYCAHCQAEHSGIVRLLFTAEVLSSSELHGSSRDIH